MPYTFRSLAETLSHTKLFEIEEVESILETHFKIYLSDFRNSELIKDDIIKQRNLLMSEKEQLDIKRAVIEKSVLDAKTAMYEGKAVDRHWLSRANLAFQITKSNLVRCQNRLSNLRTLEKRRNIEMSDNRNQNLIKILRVKLQAFMSYDEIGNLFYECDTELTNNV